MVCYLRKTTYFYLIQQLSTYHRLKNLILLITFLLSSVLAAQERRELYGRVTADEGGQPIPGIYIINTVSGVETKSAADGTFRIDARPGDVLVVYSTATVVREFKVNPGFFEDRPFIMSVSFKPYELEEVVISKDLNLSAEALGIVPKGQKVYTPAERKLYTASCGGIGSIVGLDQIINAISGRTAMLKKARETEIKEFLIEKIGNIVSEQELIEDYKIPGELVRGFVFYIVEDNDFGTAVSQKNNSLARFLLTGLSQKYLKLLAHGE